MLSHAQWYDPQKMPKKAVSMYVAAIDLARGGEYEQSIVALHKVIEKAPNYVEAYLSLAGIHAEMKDYNASVEAFEKATQMDSVFCGEYNLPYSISLAGIGAFEKALQHVDLFLQQPHLNNQSIKAANYRKSVYEFAIAYNQSHHRSGKALSLMDLGPGINSDALEYYPSVTIDQKKIIFTRRINNDEDFFESNLSGIQWDSARSAAGKINTNFNEGAQNIAQDGSCLVFTGCNYPEGMGSCDLYISYKTRSGKWTEAENLGTQVNSEFWESAPSLSPDKKDLYFSSNRPGGLGGKDIWVCHKNTNGKWSTPQNLGPKVNTSGDEASPFIHSDNQTLYFNSNGHQGYGMTDLFMSTKDSTGKFTEPDNLGYPINTIDDEGSLIVAADGKTAYFASDRKNKKAGLDIYSFELPEDIRAVRTLWINGFVLDKKTGAGLPSGVILTDVNHPEKKEVIQTDEEGKFFITLPVNKEYAFNVNRRNYLFYSDHFLLEQNSKDSFFTLNIPLQPIEKGAGIVLKNIFFDNNSFMIKKESSTELEQLAAMLQENPKLRLEISGHTDNVGKKEDNLKLSTNRAQAVVAYLITHGISAARLQAKGYGDSRPIAPNETDAGKSNNRRTEINVMAD
jgi:outer membrane protein OmpA-like peptidoglycan-associated protein/tetratricopeptide (TPR) repeat protein